MHFFVNYPKVKWKPLSLATEYFWNMVDVVNSWRPWSAESAASPVRVWIRCFSIAKSHYQCLLYLQHRIHSHVCSHSAVEGSALVCVCVCLSVTHSIRDNVFESVLLARLRRMLRKVRRFTRGSVRGEESMRGWEGRRQRKQISSAVRKWPRSPISHCTEAYQLWLTTRAHTHTHIAEPTDHSGSL